MSEQMNEATITSEEHYWAEVYSELTARYQHLPATKAMPLMAVRLLAKRFGFDRVMWGLRKHGTAWTADKARIEIMMRQEFIARMLAKFPPEDPAELEMAAREMAAEMAGIDCPAGGMVLLHYLDRLRCRELALAAKSDTVH